MMKIYVEMPRGMVTDSFWSEENIALVESLGEVTWNDLDRHLTPEEFRDALEGVDVCVCGWGVPKFDEFVLEKADRLKVIAYTAGTVSKFVTDTIYERGIHVLSGNEAFAISVAEGTMGYIIAAQRDLRGFENLMLEKGWRTATFSNRSLLGKTVGIVGFGSISRHLLNMLKPFQTRVLLYSNHTTAEEAARLGVQKATLEEMFSTCDIISLHCARNPANYHLVDRRLLDMMKPGALIVNTSRGDVIDEQALIEYLQSGKIRAALDVYEKEPLAMDSPLRQLKNAYLQPHLGGPTTDYRYAAARLVLEDVRRFQQGLPMENEISKARSAMMTK